MKMISNDKQDCIESITKVFEGTSAWRKSISTRFSDPRNMRAAETLDKLAVDANGRCRPVRTISEAAPDHVCSYRHPRHWRRSALSKVRIWPSNTKVTLSSQCVSF